MQAVMMNPLVTKIRLLLLLALLLWLVPRGAVSDELQGEIRFEPARQDAVWVGQEIELNLELWSNGFSFSDQLFVLPEVKGGYLVQADSSTVKLNEKRGDGQWLGLRYGLLFYPQREGRLEVPPFDVQFSASAGFGTEPVRFGFQTPLVTVDARLPPGAERSSLLVTTSSFSMEASWTPRVPADGALMLKVGDSLALEVKRQAEDVPGMVFAPLPGFSIEGLAAYPDAPVVKDRANRGSLTGSRTDSITFICEREGRYSIPELRFQWWDPGRKVLSEKVIPALELEVAANPAFASGPSTQEMPGFRASPKVWGMVVALLALLVSLGWLARPYLDPELRKALLDDLLLRFRKIYRKVIKPAKVLPPLNPPGVKSWSGAAGSKEP
jgi:hypothetical protein